MVVRSNAKAENRTMGHTVCKIVWLRTLLTNLWGQLTVLMLIHCSNQFPIFIASNLVFHEMIKHIKIDCHFIRYDVIGGQVSTPFVRYKDQIVDLFIKLLAGSRTSILRTKLGMLDIYAPA